MEDAQRPAASYEAYCFNCQVTFPIETRRCLHCGRPTSSAPPRRRGGRVENIAKQLSGAARTRDQPSEPSGWSAKKGRPSFEEMAGAGFPGTVANLPDEDVEEMLPARRSSPLTILWILLALTGATIRACSGGS